MSKKENEDKKKSSKKTNVKDSKDGLKDSKDPSAPSSPSLEKGASAGKGIYLALTVHSASDLFANDARGTSDPYVKIEVSGHSKKTKRINHTLNPVWEETFVIHFKAENWEGQQLSFNVYDHDRLSKDNSLGLTNHTLTRTPVDEIKVHINKLTGKKSKGSLVFVISLHSTNPDKVSIGAKHKAAAKGVGAQPPPASKEQVAESDSESSEDEGKKKVGFVDNPKVAPTTTTPRTEDSKPEVKQEEVISVEEEGDDFPFGRVTEEYEYILEDDDDEDDDLIRQQEEVMMLLLESRSILKQVVRWSWIKEQEIIKKKHEERDRQRKRRGQLSPTEIQNLLKVQQDDEDFDWISEIEELKRQLVQEIRRNHVLDKDLSRLDQRIGLLIANRGHLDALQVQEKSKRRRRRAAKKGGEEAHVPFDLSKDPKKLGHYQELFYLLQTEPRYLARSLYLVQAEQMDSFLDTTILTLYGDAFSPREEYLILQLFKLAIKNEISKIKSLADFLNATTVLPKMVITYNRRKQGLEYLKKTLGPVLKKVMEKRDLSLELQPMTIYFGMINDIETKTGEKSNLSRQITDAEAAQNPDVQQIIKRRMEALKEICQLFLDAVVNSMNNLPYGIRWICKQIKELSQERFADSLDQGQVLKVTGYFVYYRFMNLGVVAPDAHGVIDSDLDPLVRRNLAVVGKVLQNLFNFRTFSVQQESSMVPLNSFIEKNKPIVEHYFNSLVKVDEPEDYLQVNKYMELTQKTKPVILISLHEISATHHLLLENIDEIADKKDKNEDMDELRVILKDLGDAPPEIEEEEDREIQLTLTNRFKVDIEEEDKSAALYAKTKELIIPVLRTIPVETSIHRLHLTDVLESGIKFAKENKNTALFEQISKILENITQLEKDGKLSKNDRYESFVHDIAVEVTNRAAIREQQKREILRLKTTLDELRRHQKYVNEQMEQYQAYLVTAREKHYGGVGKVKGKKPKKGDKQEKTIVGPFKFSYKELEKRGVIKSSEVPQISRKKTQFLISSEEAGVFDITAKIAGISVEKMRLELDDLLERQHSGSESLELEQVTLDVNMTIHLINKFFLGKK